MSTVCNWFEHEGALRIERGESLEPHVLGCAACRRAHARYLRLGTLIERSYVIGTPAPPSDFMARLQKIAAGIGAALVGFFARARHASAAPGTAFVAFGLATMVVTGSATRGSAMPEAQAARTTAPAVAAPPREPATPTMPAAASQDAPAPTMASEGTKKRPPAVRRAPAQRAAPPPGHDTVRELMRRGLCLEQCR